MGDIKRKRKMFSRPKKLFDRTRMDEENVLVKKYGLKNKREIWKAKTAVSKLRRRAKALIAKGDDEQKAFFDKLTKSGMKVVNISDVLALTEENVFERRLQTFVVRKKLATTVKGARQLIVHKNVLVDGKVVNIPSFVVTLNLEDKISLKEQKAKTPKASVTGDGQQVTGDLASEEDVVEENVEEVKE